jgi:hypothetical protein
MRWVTARQFRLSAASSAQERDLLDYHAKLLDRSGRELTALGHLSRDTAIYHDRDFFDGAMIVPVDAQECSTFTG